MNGVLLWPGVAALSAAGAMLRFGVDAWVLPRAADRIPAGTLVVNLSGAFLLGLLTGLAPGGDVRLLLGGALLGSYSTFSTWMLQTLVLAERGRAGGGALNVAVQANLGIALAGVGWALTGGW